MKADSPKIAISEEGKELIEEFDDQFTEDDLNQTQKERSEVGKSWRTHRE